MYIATVIPIKKGMQKEYLTYFSASLIPLGSIVTVPARSKSIDAIVVSLEDARAMKSDLKSAEFQLKKIIDVKGQSPFTSDFFRACERFKDYTVSTTGAVIQALLPKTYLENISLLDQPKQSASETNTNSRENIKHEKLIFQAQVPDRIAFYRTLIREAFAKKQSVFICVPTRYDIEEWREALIKGIEHYVFAYHSDMPKKSLISSYNKVMAEPHPVLIIGTGMFLSIPRSDIKTLIVEHESSDTYKQIQRPYIDLRNFVEVLSSIQKSKLIFGDSLLRPDTLYRHEQGELGEVHSPHFRLPQAERQIVVDMKDEVDAKGIKKFAVLSEKVRAMIEYALSQDESVFLFSVRKGLAGITVCHDCGHTMLCANCSNPVVLYGAKQRNATKMASTRIFMCNKCGRKEATEQRCKECNSWNLTPLGIGTDRVYDEVKALFPKANIIQIDREATPNHNDAYKAIVEFNKNPGSILIGTEMAFSYLRSPVTHSAIISLDGLLSIPSFNITQKILHIIEKLHYITIRNVIIQTRIPDNQILKYIMTGNVLPLYREDLKEREMFGYPPYKRLIKITFSGTASETEKARNLIDQTLAKYEPQIFSAFTAKIRGHYITNTVIKVDPKDWQLPINNQSNLNSDLKENLFHLPPSFLINVDPEDLL